MGNNLYSNLVNFYNVNDENFKEFMAEIYKEMLLTHRDVQYVKEHLTEEIEKILDKYLIDGEFNINIEEKVNEFLENNQEIKDINSKLTTNTNNIKNINSQLEQKAKKYYIDAKYPPLGYLPPVGDGVTDDSEAINKIIEYCIMNDKNLYIPTGTYKANISIDLNKLTDFNKQNVDFHIFGDYLKTIIKSDNGTVLKVSGKNNLFMLNFKISDIHINGCENDNSLGVHFKAIQNFKVENVRISGCGNGAFNFEGAWDGDFNNIDVLACGKANSNTDYAYAIDFNPIQMTDTRVENCNALKFVNLRVEACPCFIHCNHNAIDNYFTNCKFEKSVINNTDMRPFKFDFIGEIGFENCFFAENSVETEVEYNKYFFDANMTNGSDVNYAKRIFLNNCNFTSANKGILWFSGKCTDAVNTSFSFCNGLDTNSPIHVKGNCRFKNVECSGYGDSRLLSVEGYHNKISISYNHLAGIGHWNKSIVYLVGGSLHNEIEIDVINCIVDNLDYPDGVSVDYQGEGNYKLLDVAETFINANGIYDLKTNVIKHGTNLYKSFPDAYEIDANMCFAIQLKGVSSLKNIKKVFNGYSILIKASGDNCTIQADGNLVPNEKANTLLLPNEVRKFTFINGIGYQV